MFCLVLLALGPLPRLFLTLVLPLATLVLAFGSGCNTIRILPLCTLRILLAVAFIFGIFQ